ncbi:hypothetical protein GUITHDRAFT_97017 [Guillardia theta CCMP2712]|uniref:ADP-ribosylation factor-like protein 6 n=2 Tax=Guillardia theta TaxID=55529 RepID=L1IPS2_GUITC|nr:hypothetical protein GUITHDRAFT_97017 [Guillardia theta CCMP2712]EKX38258.1 hypothetical protein GUITHDRAFT_97017 [Guillardia theta CCMP2712]|mmetsp:Transcript_13529/g.47048  ORF Transcript_13529/g.47048 Transcript_13529/m.47048 type:complete len:183 (+) Transcript_13529:76-624(+)|eukprot:XP_005825238.1 hypothetical protein GUITHDRAFT_97017 [Guillardia theta CCMP2712]
MGILQKILDALGFIKPQCKVLCVGLDNSGKSTVIQHLKPTSHKTEVTPTVGFNVEQFSRSNINFTVFDMSGAGKYRSLWEHYYKDAQAIIFVIDCSDKLRMCVVKEELHALLNHKDTKSLPTLFFANKIDISDHLTPVECVQYLELDGVKDRPWHITPSNALTGYGLDEGVNWISEHLTQRS